MNAIESENLAYRYRRTNAVRGLNLAVPEGSVFALLGPNGAGKTTTIKMLMNLLQPEAGRARVLGVPSTALGPREFEAIGYVSENQNLPRWMTVDQFAEYGRALHPTWDRDLESKLRLQFDLPGRRPLEHLSRGMTMKAALLAALSFRPKLLVLDEPFSGLDPLARDEFTRGLLEASTGGDWTILVSTHDIEEVERLCDWVGMIEEGRMRIAESTESLLGRYRRVEAVNVPPSSNIVPEEWLEFERSDAAVKFADRRYVAAQSETAYASAFGGAPVRIRPMTLREIFIAEARASRALGKEVK